VVLLAARLLRWPVLMRLTAGVLALTVTLGLSACASPTAPEDPLLLLERNEATWSRAGVTSYRYTIARSCFCVPESSGPVTVEVRSGQVVDRRYESGLGVSPQYSDIFTSVPGLFGLIREAAAYPAASVTVRYHPQLGYPESIAIDWVAGAVDDEVSYRISALTLIR